MFRYFRERSAIRSYVAKLSQQLAKRLGTKQHYSVDEVTQTVKRSGLSKEFIDYAYALYCERKAFDTFYASMKARETYESLRAKVSRRYFKGVRDFDAAAIIALARREFSDSFHESGLGMDGSTSVLR